MRASRFKHNPEFTQLEFYWAYADYLQVMELTEQMVSGAAPSVLGTQERRTRDGIDFTPPWKRRRCGRRLRADAAASTLPSTAAEAAHGPHLRKAGKAA